ncbi:UbiD family decarboxylase [Paenibacillus dokdonensis]|uniref:Pyrrole-2-carboxylic acid decarboxylase n=1 Tax=Paenibacillus dokdonensis TaxID=2567944 RepID=A0ABU6GLL2_9BACL|nr:UbiD family decarboxylase [Paenibacillus dokdonensis]MEC0240113.1 UbiD family decarboxylase [Paenibacillus dokdonensis]
MKTIKKSHVSFREYIDVMECYGDIVTVDQEVDWNLEMGAMIRYAYELPTPAPLFCNIKDSAPGFRVLGAPVGLSPHEKHPFLRIALSLGLPVEMGITELIEAWSFLPEAAPLPPREIKNAPCKETKIFGDDIDLTSLPVPYLHVGDGGRYINTYGVMIVRSPDGSWVNWSITRVMLHDKRTMAGVVVPSQHIGKIYEQWKALGQKMPFALCLGVDPGISMIAGYPLPDHANEADLLGGWYGKPLDVVRCESHDLHVPASSEIVIEGFASLDDGVLEGPMGEYAGYTWVGHQKEVPCFHVTAMTHRDDPIMPVVAAGTPPEENHTNWGVAIAASIQHELRRYQLPVQNCIIPFESAVHWLVVTVEPSWNDTDSYELAKRIGEVVFACRGGSYIPKVIVVNNDIDPSRIDQVVWALATRSHPDKVILFPDQPVLPLVAYLDQNEKKKAMTTKVVYNCLSPDEWPKGYTPLQASFSGYPEKLQKHVLDSFEKLL